MPGCRIHQLPSSHACAPSLKRPEYCNNGIIRPIGKQSIACRVGPFSCRNNRILDFEITISRFHDKSIEMTTNNTLVKNLFLVFSFVQQCHKEQKKKRRKGLCSIDYCSGRLLTSPRDTCKCMLKAYAEGVCMYAGGGIYT